MSTRDHESKQGKAQHGQSLAQKLRWLHVLCLVAACGDVDPIDIAPLDPNDVDADGIANAVDNCPERYNADQHDEDADAFGDACDVCPSVFDDQLDIGESGAFGFGDGVGDACDPRPTRDGDTLARFEPFSIDTTESYVGDGWTIANDAARATGDARFRNKIALAGDGLHTQLQIPSLDLTDGGFVEIALDGDGLTDGATCTLRRTGDTFELVAHELEAATMTAPIALATPLTLTAWRTIDRERLARLRCLVGDVLLEIPLLDETAGGTTTFAASGATVEISSVSVLTFPMHPCPAPPPSNLRACEI